MINKYTISRSQNVAYVKQNLEELNESNLYLSRYEPGDPLTEIAERNFRNAYDFILNNPEIENDYKCLLTLHEILMKDLDDGVKSELTQQQISELNEMINQPTKANLEIAIDVMLFILDKRLFTDGDVRAALLFSNKFMVDNGCGIIAVTKSNRDTFRTKLKQYKENNDYDIKEWIYNYCVKGPKRDYYQ